MKQAHQLVHKIVEMDGLRRQLNIWKLLGKRMVFTNGVFDILHEGHISVLADAASFADILIVGINSDASVKRLKGESRPVNNEHSRMLLIASLVMVDAVVIFEEDTPFELIKKIMPDVLVKGGDYTIENIIGAKEVIANGGRVEIVPIKPGFSTTAIIQKATNVPNVKAKGNE